MDGANGIRVGGVDNVRAGAHDVADRPAKLVDCLQDDREAAPRLRGCVAWRRRTVGLDGRGAGDKDSVAGTDGTGKTVSRFVGRS